MVVAKKLAISVATVLCIIFQITNIAQAISYDDFLQSIDDAVASEMKSDGFKASKLPAEVLQLLKEELFENRVLKKFADTSKAELTKLLIADMKSRKEYYKTNKKIFKSFIIKAMEADLKNYPDEDSGLNAADIRFLSLMTTEAVDDIIEEVIVKKNAPQDNNWNVFTLLDTFRTVYYYCKYPQEMAPLLTDRMHVAVKDWLDSTATWGSWGFENAAGDGSEGISDLKLEL
ncbi:uncharacterized protein LOC119082726 [Bradysia coprophila]|uniref:uncharacterized protein LOC119082726 n=1 Tax=Bradysia coprophila TaxID=38358 RepID=UPI00187D74CB|nr:uncharacterized protein LOC119082726 [Bradysia coprophila]